MVQLEGAVSAAEACTAFGVSRAGFYRGFLAHEPREAETELRHQIQKVALANRCYGYRRVREELRRQGVLVNHKCVARLLREDNLLSLRARKFVVTTLSQHALHQLWVAGITYLRLNEEFIYLAVALDGYSRRVIGWSDQGVQCRCPGYVGKLLENHFEISMSRPCTPQTAALSPRLLPVG
jgi:putative transposase